jgi:hypothetical protein
MSPIDPLAIVLVPVALQQARPVAVVPQADQRWAAANRPASKTARQPATVRRAAAISKKQINLRRPQRKAAPHIHFPSSANRSKAPATQQMLPTRQRPMSDRSFAVPQTSQGRSPESVPQADRKAASRAPALLVNQAPMLALSASVAPSAPAKAPNARPAVTGSKAVGGESFRRWRRRLTMVSL